MRYALAESGGDPNYQQFLDPEADLVDSSTGSFRCIETAADRVTELPGFRTGLNGYLDAPRGTYVRCTAINQTASLTLIKQVNNDNGGTATPADFDLTVTPASDAPDGVVAQTVTGSDAGAQVSVRPGVSYDLSESAVDGYELDSLECSVNQGDPEAATSLTLDVLDVAVCTFVNVDVPGTWAISKSSDPESGSTVQPGSTITYTVTATKLEGLDPQDVVVNDDVSGVLNHATIVPGSVTPSVGTAGIDGDTLTWQIPVLGGEETVTYEVLVDQDAYGVTLANAVTSPGSSACPPEAAQVRAAALDPGCPTTTKHFTPAWSLEKSSDPKSGSVVDPGSRITYTLTVTNTSDGTLEGATVTDDLSKVLAHASLVSVSDGATLAGDSLTWTVPTLTTRDETATLSYTVVVDLDATQVRLRNVATPG